MSQVKELVRESDRKARPVSQWVYDRNLKIYVRVCRRWFVGPIYADTIDLANINAKTPGKGHFTKFLTQLERANLRTLYVENVMTQRFRRFFQKRPGWTETQGSRLGSGLWCFVYEKKD